jgi:hypothetical protein
MQKGHDMGWPLGKPRKGHVNKDGSAPAKWGKKTAKIIQVPAAELDAPRRKRGRPRKGEEVGGPKWHTKLTNKGIDKCPACEFPEAYGGYCPECGHMEKIGVGKW